MVLEWLFNSPQEVQLFLLVSFSLLAQDGSEHNWNALGVNDFKSELGRNDLILDSGKRCGDLVSESTHLEGAYLLNVEFLRRM